MPSGRSVESERRVGSFSVGSTNQILRLFVRLKVPQLMAGQQDRRLLVDCSRFDYHLKLAIAVQCVNDGGLDGPREALGAIGVDEREGYLVCLPRLQLPLPEVCKSQ